MKVIIQKDGHNISDFASEKEALMWFAKNEGVDVCFEYSDTESEKCNSKLKMNHFSEDLY